MAIEDYGISRRQLVKFAAMAPLGAALAGLALPGEASAASGYIVAYLIKNQNERSYSNPVLTSPVGWIYPTDEVRVLGFSGKACNVEYPTSRGRKRAWVRTSSIFLATKGYSWTAPSKLTTYRRPNGPACGSVSKGESCVKLGSQGGWIQVFYSISGGNRKVAWVKEPAPVSTNTKGITAYQQTDKRWKDHPYGKKKNSNGHWVTAYIGGSGCGVLSLTNAVYYLNGAFIQPKLIADYSVKNGYRINNVGTSFGLYKSFAAKYGSQYGFAYVGYTNSWTKLREHLLLGRVAICHKKGHIMVVAAYDKRANKYLLLDSYKTSSRGTSPSGYRWATQQQLKSIGMLNDFYVLMKTR